MTQDDPERSLAAAPLFGTWLAPTSAPILGSSAVLGRVLVACEYSGSVRDAFSALGWDAWSCDILPSEKPGNHYQGDVRDILGNGWDILIAHPPCTHLAVSGARWFPAKRASGEQQAALDFVRLLLNAPIPHIALENPISIISSQVRRPDQVIQPWQHGHGETKATCLWLKGLPKLQPSNVVEGREQRIWKLPPSADRWKERSRTFTGIAKAMAVQWTNSTRPNVPALAQSGGEKTKPKEENS
jgi:site-specific DNA-cytosine methylase